MCPTMKCHFSGRTVTRAGTVMKSSAYRRVSSGGCGIMMMMMYNDVIVMCT